MEYLIQWHLTARCDQKCWHCYMKEQPTYLSEIRNELSLSDCKKVIDDYADLMKMWKMQGMINFTGGDPLLRDDFFEILNYAVSRGIKCGILGNPYHITDETAKLLKGKITHYQLSIDGRPELHNKFRKKGSFDDTIRAIRILKKHRIRTLVMFTLSRVNMNDIFYVMEKCNEEGVDVFDFARLVPTGCGKSYENDMLTPVECKKLFKKIDDYWKDLNSRTRFGRKDNLWKLYFYENGAEIPKNQYTGCSFGIYLSILADGSVMSCRRIPIIIGKVPRDKLKQLILFYLKPFRDYQKYECFSCELSKVCRGCPAISYALTGSYTVKDPCCWKEVNYGQNK
ncbi:MAG: radical SAM protein [Candidatus Altiarchaeota archaeon]